MEPQVGPYRIIERLGAGGMGEVYLAEDSRLGRRVALKRLSDVTLGDHDARQRILREAAAAATLNHPNVAAVYDVLDFEGRAYIVMEFVPGQSLADQLHHGGPLAPDRVVQLGLQLCDALEEAHRHEIVHRDLKPANVRVTPEGRVKVLDFGLARRPARLAVAASGAPAAAVVESLALADGQVIGTPAYMAPEVLLGETADRRSDLYSLGVTLFELAVGHPPFQGTNFMSVALAVLTEPPPPITSLLPGGLGEIVARAMARDPAQRYQSAVALRRDLASLSAEFTDRPTGPHHVPSSIRERLLGVGRQRAQLRTTLWVAAAAIVLVVVAGALTVGLRRPSALAADAANPVVAVVALPTVSDTPAHDSLGLGVAAELGGYLANAVSRATIVSSGSVPPQVQTAGLVTASRDLGATYLVPVLVQVQGGRVQVNAQLVRAAGQAVLGSATERGALGDAEFFDVQRRLGVRVAGMLAAQVGASVAAASTPQPETVSDFAEYSAAIAMLARRFVAGNVDRAVATLEGVVSRSPGFAAAHAGLSQAYLTQFHETNSPTLVDRALDSARRAVDLDPQDVRGPEALASAYQAAGQHDEAVQALTAALDRQPRSDALRRMLGEVLVRSGRADAGLAELAEAVRLRPAFADNHTALGLSLYALGRHQEALAALTRAVELMPDDPLARQRLGAAYHQLGQLDPALAQYREAVRLGGTAGAYANLATILYRQGKFDDALAGYERSLNLRPGSYQTWRSKGDVLNRLGRLDEARQAWTRAATLAEDALKANPEDARTLGFLAVCRAKLGDMDQARTLAATAMRAAPDQPDVLYRGAVVNALTGRLDEGRRLLARALAAGYSASEAAVDDDLRALGPVAARAAK